jgi:integrase
MILLRCHGTGEAFGGAWGILGAGSVGPVWEVLGSGQVAAGIPTRIVPHQLRHTYASEMVRSGVTLPAVMKLLGHADPQMTNALRRGYFE